jgi:NADH:ubiquinone oxidoreductase subunit F (NADH-binding)
VLVGGYFGTWAPATVIPTARLSTASLLAHDASFGCGVLVALPRDHCGLTESARVTQWLAAQNAGQCGPCVKGLDAIARAMGQLVSGDRNGNAEHHLHRWLEMVKGRGACKHPDGTARFVESTLRVFADEADRHRRGGPCHLSHAAPVLPVPKAGSWR